MAANGLGKRLKEFYKTHGVNKAKKYFAESIKKGKIPKEAVSLRDLAETFCGSQWQSTLEKRYKSPWLLEASEAVDASAFSNITGQLLVNEIKENYNSAEFVGLKLVETVPITNGNLGTQVTPWLGSVIDAPEQIQAGMQYPMSKFPEQWITYPAPQKFGQIVALTFEMIFADLTGQALKAARGCGRRVGILQEENILKVILGLTNNHIWNGTSYNTYLTAGSWVNTVSGQTLVDWTSMNAVEQLFANMLDPVSSKAIDVQPNALLCMPYRYYNAKRVLHATETRTGNIAASPGNQVVAPNPIEVDYPIYKSKFAYQLLLNSGLTPAQAQEYFYLGDFKEAFVWRQVYPLRVVEAPPQNPAEFNQDIVMAVKAQIYGVAGTRDPRYVAESYNT